MILNWVDIVIILFSLVVVVAVGLWAASKQDRDARGYFLASGSMPWYIIGTAIVSTSVSSEQIVGTVGTAYKYGMGVTNWEWFTLPTYTLTLVFFIPMYLRNRIMTVPEFLNRRFGPLCGTIYSWVMLVAYTLVFMVPVLYGGSLAFSQLLGFNFYAVLWGMIVLVGLYSVKGGLASVMWTDAAQCLMLVGGGILLFFIALTQIPGGWTAMMQASPERFHLYRPPNDPLAPFTALLCGVMGLMVFYQAGNQVMIQRIFGARSRWDGMMGIVFAGFINFVRPLVTCFLGFIVYHWIFIMKKAAPLSDPDHTFAFGMQTFAPEWGLRGIILAGFLAAVMSTVSALSNSTATIFSLDVYQRLINRQAGDKKLVITGKLASLTALIIGGLLAPLVPYFGGIFLYFQRGVTFLATPFISVMLLGLFWKRANYPGALFGLIAGFPVQLAVVLVTSALGYQLHWLYLAFFAQAITMTGVVIVSLLVAAPLPETANSFIWSPKWLTEYADSEHRPWYCSVLLWYGIYAAVWAFLYWRYW